jgi:hypothetical protein
LLGGFRKENVGAFISSIDTAPKIKCNGIAIRGADVPPAHTDLFLNILINARDLLFLGQ